MSNQYSADAVNSSASSEEPKSSRSTAKNKTPSVSGVHGYEYDKANEVLCLHRCSRAPVLKKN